MTGYLWRGQPDLERINAEIMTWRKPGGRNGATSTGRLPKCGTEAGYKRHRQLCEPPCDACTAATTEARRQRKERRAG